MQTLELTKKSINLKAFVKREAAVTDVSRVITADTVITAGGTPVILYKRLDGDLTDLKTRLRAVSFGKSDRTAGLKTHSRTFGYAPKNTIRNDFCTAAAFSWEYPQTHKVLFDWARELSVLYQEYFPEIYARHNEWTQENVRGEWQIQGTPFTSGIINKTSQLKYHFDAGNVKDMLSAMLVLRHDTTGGYLSCPEFDVAFECADQSILLFNGQNILHGVTPIGRQKLNAWRFSIVYYTLQLMWNCEPITEELTRIRALHLKRERLRGTRKRDELAS